MAAAGLAACTSGGKRASITAPNTSAAPTISGAPTTSSSGSNSRPVSAYCGKLVATATKVTAAQGALYRGGSSTQGAITTLVAELKALQDGAPSDVKTALTDMISAFQTAAGVLQHPTAQNQAQITALGTKLSADGQAISAYLTSKCPSH
ncbi:MAG: hypothetical protein JWO57_2054 [Pseudonocardiales bacterium]|nr:hypothetical protein [Pseudonocardiales bacterium]